MKTKDTFYFGEFFKKEAKRQKLSYAKLADELGLNDRNGIFFRFNKQPDRFWVVFDVVRLCEVLHVDSSELIKSVYRRNNAD